MGKAEWVQAGASQMREMGNELCLRQLLDVLGDKAGRTYTERMRDEHAYRIFPAWYRSSDQEEY